MSKIVRRIIAVVVAGGLFITEPFSFNLFNTKAYASENRPSLKSIYLSDGDDIAFDEDIHSYIVDLDKDTEEIYVKAKPEDDSDKVKINGQDVTENDSYKRLIKLNKGRNTIKIEVQDDTNNSKSKYTVFVYRGGKEAVYLKDINIDGVGIGFINDINSYNLELDDGTEMVDLETMTEDGNYLVTVNGAEVNSDNSIKLRFKGIGKYTLNVKLKDQDTGREGSYTLNIYLGIPVTPNVSDAINSVLKPSQWVIVNGRWRYNDALGKPLKDIWYYDYKFSSYFHFNKNGNMQTGWLYDGGNYYYLKQNGEMYTGWLEYENEWYYLDNNGVMRIEWAQDNGNWYYLKRNGAMASGWIISNDRWYYLRPSGDMETGWMYYGKKWYYLNSSGAMETGWIKYKDEWYFLNNDGSMKSGEWFYYKDNWYYLNTYGNMRTGWLLDRDEKIYYLNQDGTMNATSKTIDGYTYEFNNDGSVNLE